MGSARHRRSGATRAVAAGSRSGALARGLPAGFAGLQRAAGNRAVGQLLRAPSIRVREGSKLSAAEFAAVIGGNKNVPAWLRKGIGAKGDALTAGRIAPNEATSLSKDKRNVIVVVREIEVTAPNGKTRTFTPSADNMAEAILHEIAIHAGRIAQGLPDTHDETSAVIRELVDQIGACFRTEGAGGELERSPLTTEILAFVAAN